MTGPLYDEVQHVLSACEVARGAAGYRPLVFALNCALGESLPASRLAGAGLMVAAFWLFGRAAAGFAGERGRGGLPWLAAHPVTLFPFFYGSQISTAITIFVGSGFAAGLAARLGRPAAGWRLGAALVGIAAVVGVLSAGLRQETVVVGGLLAASALAIAAAWRGPTALPGRELRRRALAVLGATAVAAIVQSLLADAWFGAGAAPATADLFRRFGGALVEGRDREGYFPLVSHAAVQAYALALYARNLVWPWGLEFYGPWGDWQWIHRHAWTHVAAPAVVVAGLLVPGAWLIRAWRRGAGRPASRLAALGWVAFLGASAAVSAIPRLDWYFPSRGMLPAFLVLGALAFAAARPEASPGLRRGARAFAVYSLAALVWLASTRFSSSEAFFAAEIGDGEGRRSPVGLIHLSKLTLSRAAGPEDRETWRRARSSLFQAYRLIDQDLLPVSTASEVVWRNALVRGYDLSRRIGDVPGARSAARALLRSLAFDSTLVCLREESIPRAECATAERRDRFCPLWRAVRSGRLPLETALPADFLQRRMEPDPDQWCSDPSDRS